MFLAHSKTFAIWSLTSYEVCSYKKSILYLTTTCIIKGLYVVCKSFKMTMSKSDWYALVKGKAEQPTKISTIEEMLTFFEVRYTVTDKVLSATVIDRFITNLLDVSTTEKVNNIFAVCVSQNNLQISYLFLFSKCFKLKILLYCKPQYNNFI